MLTIWVQTGAQRPASVRIRHADVVKLGSKAVTIPSITLVFQPAWMTRSKGTHGGYAPDNGPDYIVLENLPPTTVAALLKHSDFGKGWKNLLNEELEARAGELGIARCDKIPAKPIVRTFEAEDLETIEKAFEKAGMVLPSAFHATPEAYLVPDSQASQGTLGAGSMAKEKG